MKPPHAGTHHEINFSVAYKKTVAPKNAPAARSPRPARVGPAVRGIRALCLLWAVCAALAICGCRSEPETTVVRLNWSDAVSVIQRHNRNNTLPATSAGPLPEYHPRILEELGRYAPVFPYAEENAWMDPAAMRQVYTPTSALHLAPGYWYALCLPEALQGNPRAVACMAEVTSFTDMSAQRAAWREHGFDNVPDAMLLPGYWLALGDRFMFPGWTMTRVADTQRGHMRDGTLALVKYNGVPEAAYLAYKSMPAGHDLQLAQEGGWLPALGEDALLYTRIVRRGYREYPYAPAMPENALRSAYGCSLSGASALAYFYEEGVAGFPRDNMLKMVWLAVERYEEARLAREDVHDNWEFHLPLAEAQYVRRNAALIINQCAAAREAARERYRPQWERVRREFLNELARLRR